MRNISGPQILEARLSRVVCTFQGSALQMSILNKVFRSRRDQPLRNSTNHKPDFKESKKKIQFRNKWFVISTSQHPLTQSWFSLVITPRLTKQKLKPSEERLYAKSNMKLRKDVALVS